MFIFRRFCRWQIFCETAANTKIGCHHPRYFLTDQISMKNMILIKLGGSIITNKEKPLSPRIAVIDRISKHLKKINEPMVLVHGGGSFGHYWSVKYDMHTKPAKYPIHGVSVVKNSMIHLDQIILDSLVKSRLSPYSLPPTDFMFGNKPVAKKVREISKIAGSGLI